MKHTRSRDLSKKKKHTIEVPSTKTVADKTGVMGIAVIGKNNGQKEAIRIIQNHEVSVIHGVPGTGKTHLAVGLGLHGLLSGHYERLILTRPYVEAGEHLGFLPGGFNQKIAPFMLPVMEISMNYLGKEALNKFVENGNITVMPLAYMRGITFNKAFVVADEMQNATTQQMRMLLTRIGDKCKMVITGDTQQSDLYYHQKNGLADAINRLKNIKEIGFCHLDYDSCVRSALVSKIDEQYR